MHESFIASVSSHLVVRINELLLDLFCPEVVVEITASTVPLLGVLPRILQSNQVDLLRLASVVIDNNCPYIKQRVHMLRL